jgi:hypothetical protein
MALIGAALLVAACGGSSSPRPANAQSRTSSAAASRAAGAGAHATGAALATGLLAYASCVRAHGVPSFPDPAGAGWMPKESEQQLGVSNSQLEAGQRDCGRLLAAGDSLSGQPDQTVSAEQQRHYLAAAACMRSRGITNFPDPIFSDGQVGFPMLSRVVDIRSTQFTETARICQKLIPAGLPFSGSRA